MEITFHLPNHFVLPAFYEREDPEKIAMALRLGAEAVEQLYEKAESTIRQETHEQASKQLEAEYQALDQKRQKEIQTLREKLTALEAMNSTWQASLNEKAEALVASRLKDKDSQIQSLTNLLNDLGGKMERLGESVYKHSSNSSVKGRTGEVQVEEMLKLALDSEISATNKEAYSADHHLIRGKGKYKYLIDTKNYSRAVNQQEVEKLHRDLRLNADAQGAIMISLNQPIVGHSRAGDLDIEFNEAGKPIVFIGNLLRREEPMVLFASLRPFFEVVERLHEVKQQGGGDLSLEHEKWATRATLVASLVRNHLEHVVKSKNEFVNNKKKMEAIFAEIYAKMLQGEGQVKNILAIALGDEGQMKYALQDVDMPLPSSVFSKTSRTDLTEREGKFVEWIEKTFQFEDGKEVEVKIFLEKAAAVGFNDKEARGMREKIFKDEAWPKLAKKIRGLHL
jgi:hypothetical protein